MVSGKIAKKTVYEKQVVFWSKKYADRARAQQEEVVKKALELVADPKKYNKAITYGAAKYVKNLEFDKDTGEVLEGSKRPYFDSDKMAEEEKYDGYYAIVWIVYISLPRHHSYAYYFADLIREGIKA